MERSWRIYRRWISVFLVAGGLGWVLQPAGGQSSFNEREVKSQSSEGEKGNVWTLDFRFKDPRLIKASTPGRGTRIYWYLWYQVINRTGAPRVFVPEFELVTLDEAPAVYTDDIYPSVQEAIKRLEDPTGYQDIKNSVTISSNPIPPSKPNAFPRAVTGVAIWEASTADPAKRDPKVKDLTDATRFSIFVRGLSNGSVTVDPLNPGDEPITRYRTLQLNFRRQGDRLDARDITFVAPAEWIYRAGRQKSPLKGAAPKAGK
jgi:hypothetical protein